MKHIAAAFVIAFLPVAARAAVTNTAAAAGWCYSLALDIGSGAAPGGTAQIAFSTYDGAPNRFLTQPVGDGSIVSSELRVRAGAVGVYETDYAMFRSSAYIEVGTLALTLPTTDADTNGVPDVVQITQAGSSGVGGNGTQEWPQTQPFAASGQFTRNAGSALGTYALAWTNFAGPYALGGTWRVLHFDGPAVYSRGLSNVLRLQLTLVNQNGTSLVLTGSTAYTIRSAGEVLVPQLRLSSGTRIYTAQPMTLARSGQRYAGNLRFFDGAPETNWRDYADWAVVITDTNDANTNGIPDFSDPLAGPDVVLPKVSINFPAANARLTNAQNIVQGTASDDRGLARVLYSLNGAPFTDADGTNIWLAPVTLVPGTNTFAAKAVDTATNESAVVTRRFIHVVASPLTVQIVGAGRVTPDLHGRLLEVGRRYTLTAVPAASNLFAFWSGGTNASRPALTFTMTSNLVLAANFVPNPFLPLTGAYSGLFAEPGNVVHETAGHFSARLANLGTFSGSLRRAGRTLAFSGQFGLDGKATNRIRLSPTNQLLMTLCLDLTNGTQQITGELAETGRVAVATMDAHRAQPRSATNLAGRWPGKYTLSLPPVSGDGPLGAGLASASADTNGNARLSGFLADGTAFTAAGALSKDGLFPLYLALYGGRGSIFCPLWLTNEPGAELTGAATWTKPARSLDARYPAGFRQALETRGSLYSLNAVTNALAAASQIVVELSALPTPASTNLVLWNRGTRLTNSDGFSLTLAPATGLWSGVYPEPQSRQRLSFRTTLRTLPGGAAGEGFVIQSNLSGRVSLTLTP